MGLDDNAEKLAYAWRQVEEAEFDSEQYHASFEYLYKNCPTVEEWAKLLRLDAYRWGLAGAMEDDSPVELPDSDPQ